MIELPRARWISLSRLGASLCLIWTAACKGEHRPDIPELWDGSPPFSRRVDADAWDTAWAIGGGTEDTTLLRPRLVTPHGAGVYLFDDGREQVISLDPNGNRRWGVGGTGGGPTEFRMVRDIKVDDLGRAVVLDPGNQRIAVIDPAGRFVRRVPITAIGWAEQVLPLGDSRYVLATSDSMRPFVVLDSTGGVVERFGIPWKPFASLDPLARQGTISQAGGGRWIYGFTLGDGWFVFDGTRPQERPGRYVEHTDFPAVVQTRHGNTVTTQMEKYVPCSACTLSGADSVFYVHFGGHTPEQKRLVDRYAISNRRYLGSYRLPTAASAVMVFGGRAYVLQSDTATRLLALTPRISTAAGRR
jgi:hypothetical protein